MGQQTVAFRITQHGPPADPKLAAELFSPGPLDGVQAERLLERLRFFLSLDDDPAALRARAAHDLVFLKVLDAADGDHHVKSLTPFENAAWHPYQGSGVKYAFTTRAGTAGRPDNLRRPMNRLCAAAGVPVLTPHKLRHSWTSLLAAQGITVEVLSVQLGHANASITRDIYRHVFQAERVGLTYDPTPEALSASPSRPAPQRCPVTRPQSG